MRHLSIGDQYPEIVNVLIEIEKGGRNKYEYDFDLNVLKLDKVLNPPLAFPENYGFILETLSEDNNNSDILIITKNPLIPGSLIKVKILGAVGMSDDKGIDNKFIGITVNDPDFSNINRLGDVDKSILDHIYKFFFDYKEFENNSIKVGDWIQKEEAIELVKKAHNALKGL